MMSIRAPSRVEYIENLLEVFGRDGDGESVVINDESQHDLLLTNH